MQVDTNAKIRTLLEELPALEDILGWYDVNLGRQELDMTLVRLCKEYDLDLEDILNDIEMSEDDDDDSYDDDSDDEDDDDED